MPSSPRISPISILASGAVAVLCLSSLIGCGKSELESLLDDLQGADVKLRRQAAQTLGENPAWTVAAKPQLLEALADSDHEVRRLSCRALASAGGQVGESVAALKPALKDSEVSVRLAAAYAIQQLDPDDDSFPHVLIEAMKHGDGGVIVEVGRMGEGAAWAAPTMIQLLRDRRAGIRRLAANGLEQLGVRSPSVKSALQTATRDADDRVREAAQQALKSLDSSS